MKKIVSYCLPLLFVVIILTGCEKSGGESDKYPEKVNLKEAVDYAALQITEAVESIELSNAYSLFQQGASTKSGIIDDAPAVNIYLDDLKGVYAYAPVLESTTSAAHHDHKCKSYFERIDDSEWFVIQLPHEKVAKPYRLFDYDPNVAIVNNFKITTSEFLFESDKSLKWHNYHLATRFDLENEYAGYLWVDEMRKEIFKFWHHARFGFTTDYFISVLAQLSDTAKLGYSLENAENDTLFSEMISFSLRDEVDSPIHHFAYEVMIGDIQIVRTLDEDNQMVYLLYKGGELREDAIVSVIASEGEGPNGINYLFMNKNIDIQIMLSDEPPFLLSDLIGDSQEVLSSLFASMREFYLSKMIINRLAWQIYREQHGGTDD